MSVLQSWISHSAPNIDVMASIKACACVALRALLRSQPGQAVGGPRLMRPGAERC